MMPVVKLFKSAKVSLSSSKEGLTIRLSDEHREMRLKALRVLVNSDHGMVETYMLFFVDDIEWFNEIVEDLQKQQKELLDEGKGV